MSQGLRPLGRVLRRAQHGAVLFIALIVLVAMSLAGLAMMRGVETGALIANNLAFKQGATMAADAGVEAGRNWLLANGGAALLNSNAAGGYFAQWDGGAVGGVLDLYQSDADPANDFDWPSNSVALTTDAAGNTVRYVIHRLCKASGTAVAKSCVQSTEAAAAAGSSTKGAPAFGGGALATTTDAFYRITVRVIGPRNTVAYVQAVVY
jgi:Tfp pilus assembly protein PilX